MTPLCNVVRYDAPGDSWFGPFEPRPAPMGEIERLAGLQEVTLDGGLTLVCDRYTASSVAYGEAQGLDGAWLVEIQKFLPPPSAPRRAPCSRG